MIVMKFGGSSLGNAYAIRKSADIVEERKSFEKDLVVVTSAVGTAKGYETKVTDALIKCATQAHKGNSYESDLSSIYKRHKDLTNDLMCNIKKKYSEEQTWEELVTDLDHALKNRDSNFARFQDLITSYGERLSANIFTATLRDRGIDAEYGLFHIITDENFGNAEVLDYAYNAITADWSYDEDIKEEFKQDKVWVSPGFIGMTPKGEITTLGRGGSDLSAAVIGAALDADYIEIWTDVNGIMTADPNLVSNAKTAENLSFAEAAQLAHFGSRVLYPKAIEPAMEKNIPVYIFNTFKPDNSSTKITRESEAGDGQVKAIAHKEDITLINVESTKMVDQPGYLAHIFEAFSEYGKSVDMLATSETSISLTVDNDIYMSEIKRRLKPFATVTHRPNMASINVVGEGIGKTVGVTARTLKALADNDVNHVMLSEGASSRSIGLVVDQKYLQRAVNVLHDEFFPEVKK